MSKVSKLLSDIVEVDEEVTAHDMEAGGSGGSFINECGVYPTTIEKAFMTPTKKGGVALNLHFGGANKIDTILYIVSVKNKKKVTTCVMQGKTVSLPSFKMFKQLYFLATGEGLDLHEMKTVEETIKYKSYGKDVEVEAETITELIGKELQIGIRLCESYNYEDGETDKTQVKTNQNGDTVYDKELESVFNVEGFSAEEVINDADETKAIESKKKFFASDKAIKRVKLEEPEVDEDEDPFGHPVIEIDEDEIPF